MGPEQSRQHHVRHHVLLLALPGRTLHLGCQLLAGLLLLDAGEEAGRQGSHWDSEAEVGSHIPEGPPEWLR